MEQATNLFNKGLQIDTHPMVQGNDTLTDCLNGTLITMNGNEVVLQNDMGNRKIDHAYLPEGYEPVGIREYGGIIYIACYNPITGRGQIGSFPSPERIDDDLSDNEIYLDLFNDFIELKEGKYIVKKDYVLKPLTGEITLHAGDKFKLFGRNFDILQQYITTGNNNLFTFRVGILNSLNEFIDITDLLKNYSNSESKEFFLEYNLDAEDENFSTFNIYPYKIVSPLYLLVSLNHIISGEVKDLYIEKTDDNKLYHSFSITYTYKGLLTDNYIPKIIVGGNELNNINIKRLEELLEELEEGEFLKKTISYYFNIPELDKEYTILIKYLLCDLITTTSDQTVYYESYFDNHPIFLQEEDYIKVDPEFIMTDTIKLNYCRYYNDFDLNRTLINLNLSIYKKINSDLKNEIYIALVNEENLNFLKDESITWTSFELINGSGEYILEHNEFPFRLDGWKIALCYKKRNSDTKILLNSIKFITTELLNGNYEGNEAFNEGQQDSGEYLYKNIDGTLNYNYSIHKYAYIEDFRKIEKIYITPTLAYKVISKDTKQEYLANEESELNTSNLSSYTLKYKTINTYNLSYKVVPLNEELYPEGLLSCNSTNLFLDGEDYEIYLGNTLFSEMTNDDFIEKNGTYEESNNNNIPLVVQFENPSVEIELNNIKITFNEIVNNFWRGGALSRNINILKVITSFCDFLKDTLNNYITRPYICIDAEKDSSYAITSGFNYDSYTYSDENRLDFTGSYWHNKEMISNYISDITTNLFIGESSLDDYILPYEDTINNNSKKFYFINSNSNNRHSFRRIWFRYAQNKYIPIICSVFDNYINDENHNYKLYFEDLYEYILVWAKSVPHLFVYDTQNSSHYIEGMVDLNNSIKSIEFNYPVKLVLLKNLNEGIINIKQSKIYNLFPNFDKKINITLLLNNIKSDEKFIELSELVKNDELDCVAIFIDYDEQTRSGVTNKLIYLVDSKGNLFDPSYVYKYTNSSVNKSYIPSHKFTLGNNYLFPNFDCKSSRSPNNDAFEAMFLIQGTDNRIGDWDKYEEKDLDLKDYEGNSIIIPDNLNNFYYLFNHNFLRFRLPDIYTIPTME